MYTVNIQFKITQKGHPHEADIDEPLKMTPHGSRNWYEVRKQHDEVLVTGEGENLTAAVLDYLRKRKALVR